MIASFHCSCIAQPVSRIGSDHEYLIRRRSCERVGSDCERGSAWNRGSVVQSELPASVPNRGRRAKATVASRMLGERAGEDGADEAAGAGAGNYPG